MGGNPKVATRAGATLAGIWTLFLAVSFLAYPKPDNLATGLLIHALLGVDALGRLTWGAVLAVAVLQVGACFGIGYVIGLLLGRGRDD